MTVWTQAPTDFRVNGGDVQALEGSANTSVTNEAISYTFTDVIADSNAEIIIDWGHVTTDRGANQWASFTAVSIIGDAAVGDISIALISETQVELSFDTSPKGYYGIEAKGDLGDGWTSIISDIPGTGSEVSVTNTLTSDVEFYRAYIQE